MKSRIFIPYLPFLLTFDLLSRLPVIRGQNALPSRYGGVSYSSPFGSSYSSSSLDMQAPSNIVSGGLGRIEPYTPPDSARMPSPSASYEGYYGQYSTKSLPPPSSSGFSGAGSLSKTGGHSMYVAQPIESYVAQPVDAYVAQPVESYSSGCLNPQALGIPFVTSCEDFKTYALLPNVVVLEGNLENCEWMNDVSCSKAGSGENEEDESPSKGLRLSVMPPGVGKCLSISTKSDNKPVVENGGWFSDPEADVLCCRPICVPSTSTTTTTTALPFREALLALDDKDEYPDGNSVRPLSRIPVYTTPPDVSMPLRDMCLDVQYLQIPRVKSCADLRDAAISSNLVELTKMRISECTWERDVGCGPTYPGHGAFLHVNMPHKACLGYRQASCGNLVGPFPILQKDVRDVCSRPGMSANPRQEMMPIMIPVPNNPPTKSGHVSASVVSESGLGVRRRLMKGAMERSQITLHGMKTPTENLRAQRNLAAGDYVVNHAGGETLTLCCRLDCRDQRIEDRYRNEMN